MTTAAREGMTINNNDNKEQDDETMNESVLDVTNMIIDDVDDDATGRKQPTQTKTITTSTSASKILSSLPESFQIDDRVLCIGQSTVTSTSTNTSINKKRRNNSNNTTIPMEYFEAVIRDSRYEFNNDNCNNDCNMLLSATTISGDNNDDFNDSLSAFVTTGSRYWNYLVHYIGWNKRWDRWIPYEPSSSDRDRGNINATDADLLNLPILPDTIEIRQYLKDRKQFQCSSSNNNDENTTSTSLGNIEMDSILSNTTNSTHSINASNKRLKVTSSSSSPNKRSKTARSSDNNNNRSSSSSTSSEAGVSSLVYSDYCELPVSLKTILIDENDRITRSGYQTPNGYEYVNVDDEYVDQENATTCSSNNNNNNNLTATTTTSKYDSPPRLVHVLPASVPVQKVIDHFRKKKIKELRSSNDNTGSSTGANMSSPNKKVKVKQQSFDSTTAATSSLLLTESDIDSFCTGILQLFEASLSKCLLYPQERPQYDYVQRKLQKRKQKEQQQNDNDSASKSNNQLAEIYGCEFLLRLFVQLPILLQPSAEEFLQFQPSPESALAVLSSSDTGTDMNNTISNNANTHLSSTTTSTFPILNNPLVLGPLLVELLVLMQKNKQSLFKLIDNYRSPIHGKEWLDWEYTAYKHTDKKKQSKK